MSNQTQVPRTDGVRRASNGIPVREGFFSGRCTLSEGILGASVMKQFVSNGKTYLVTTTSGSKGLSIDAIFEVDVNRLDRSDLRKGQKKLEGKEYTRVLRSLAINDGEFYDIFVIEERSPTARAVNVRQYLGTEQRPQSGEHMMWLSAAGGSLTYTRI